MNTHTRIAIGIDIGSTTVKAVVCDPETLEILWSDYQRHETRQPEKTLEFWSPSAWPSRMPSTFRSSVRAQAQDRSPSPLGAKFVQEVNAVTLAVEKLHPDVGSVIELGGQDAKIIMFRDESTRTAMRPEKTP